MSIKTIKNAISMDNIINILIKVEETRYNGIIYVNSKHKDIKVVNHMPLNSGVFLKKYATNPKNFISLIKSDEQQCIQLQQIISSC